MIKSNSKFAGFSLIELTIVLAIMSFIAGGALVLVDKYSEKQRYDNTVEKMNFIMKTIVQYVSLYGRVPCPANAITAALSTNTASADVADTGVVASYGSAWTTLPTDLSNPTCYDSTLGVYTASVDTRIGTVPFYTLAISPDFMLDGWGRRFTYAMFHNAKNVNSLVASLSMTNSPQIQNLGGTTIMSDAVVVLVSHGANGYKAWSGRGSSGRTVVPTGVTLSAAEAENTDEDVTFVQGNPMGSTTDSGFDDIVMGASLWQLTAR